LYIFPRIYNITYICIGPIFHTWEKMWPLAFSTWFTSPKLMFSSSIHLPANDKSLFFFMAE
jgi:hypothetical protein